MKRERYAKVSVESDEEIGYIYENQEIKSASNLTCGAKLTSVLYFVVISVAFTLFASQMHFFQFNDSIRKLERETSPTILSLFANSKPYELKKIRTSAMKYSPAKPSDALLIKENPKCKKWAVMTASEPTEAVLKMTLLYPRWCTVVVATTPKFTKQMLREKVHAAYFLSTEDQQKLPFQSVRFINGSPSSRKNVGYLFAIFQGAEMIFDLDEYSVVERKMDLIIPNTLKPKIARDNLRHAFNPYKFFQEGSAIWPRGYPLEKMESSKETSEKDLITGNIQNSMVAVIQLIPKNEPDEGAMFSLTKEKSEINLNDQEFIVSPLSEILPTNSKSTIYFQKVFWALWLPASVHTEVGDIWRAFVTQDIYQEFHFRTLFRGSHVSRKTPKGMALENWRYETPLYVQGNAVLDYLLKQRMATLSFSSIFDRWNELYEFGVISPEKDDTRDLEALQAFFNDLETIGFNLKNSFRM